MCVFFKTFKILSKKLALKSAIFGSLALISSALILPQSANAAKIRDLANIVGVRDNQLIGYGLVVGLNGTGDKTTSTFTMQSLSNMLESVNVKVDPNDISSKNAAAVMVTAKLPAFARQGDRVDLLVSSIGDAKSLEGGTLLLTPLSGLDGKIYAVAQGAIGIGGKAERGGAANHPLAAQIPGGAIVEREVSYDLYSKSNATLSLRDSNFQNAVKIQSVINANFKNSGAKPAIARVADFEMVQMGNDFARFTKSKRPDKNSENKEEAIESENAKEPQEPVATAIDPRTIKLNRPQNLSMVEFLAQVQDLEVDLIKENKIIINERTGTIIAGMGVEVSPVVVTHNDITIKVSNEVMNDPEAVDMGGGAQFSAANAMISANGAPTTIASVTRALQRMGASPKDVISILETMKKAGAFNADFEII